VSDENSSETKRSSLAADRSRLSNSGVKTNAGTIYLYTGTSIIVPNSIVHALHVLPYRISPLPHNDIFFTGSTAPLGPWPLIFQSHDRFTDGGIPWASDQLVGRPLPKHRTRQTQNKHIYQTSMPCVGFEPTIPSFEQAKTVHALDPSVTVIGSQ
jgi:hypothetical protein